MLHKCNEETHNKCENSALCHLCDGVRLYKNSKEERARKLEAREANKQAERNAAFRTYKSEKKEGMAFEKDVTKSGTLLLIKQINKLIYLSRVLRKQRFKSLVYKLMNR